MQLPLLLKKFETFAEDIHSSSTFGKDTWTFTINQKIYNSKEVVPPHIAFHKYQERRDPNTTSFFKCISCPLAKMEQEMSNSRVNIIPYPEISGKSFCEVTE